MSALAESPTRVAESRSRRGFGSRASGAVTTVALVVAVALAGLMLVPPLFGLERYVITGSSMSGSIERGSIVYEEVVAVDELEIGDVITYEPPAKSGVAGAVTHRIIAIDDRGASPVIRTKGDANASPDPWRFRLASDRQGRVVADVPHLGYLLSALGVREVRMGLIGIPALLVAIALVAGLWRDAGTDASRRTAPGATAGD